MNNDSQTSLHNSHARPASISSISSVKGPQVVKKYLSMSADDLTIKDVRELLAEYKRIAQHLT